ncbi:MAG: beta-hexosaminidase [Lachnospiraceae bacterium]|nr:beta-hexosaminidase [Lachnospiraceae bacterium]
MAQNINRRGPGRFLALFFLVLSFVIVIGIPVILLTGKLRGQRTDEAAGQTEFADASTSLPSGESSGTSTEPSGDSDADSAAPASGNSTEPVPDSPTEPISNPQPSPTPEPSESDTALARAAAILETMTPEEKVAQMFFVRCPSEDAANLAAEYQPGGYILFGNDFKDGTPESVTAVIQSYQDAVKIPLLIGVDEEGGTVNRVSRYSAFRKSPFLSPRALYSEGGFDLIKSDTIEKCTLLKSLGINVNLAPVCDLSGDSEDFMYQRAFSGDPDEVSEYVTLVVSTMNEQGMGCTLKHFPGYGNNVDTHTGIALDERPLSQFYEEDLVPFLAGIQAGAGSILVSHNIVTCLDDSRPASLSPAVHELLREKLGYTGVIMTDDLIMDAITQYTDGSAAAVLAVQAGNDLLICSDLTTQLPAVIEAVREGILSIERIEESVIRILLWKMELGLLPR